MHTTTGLIWNGFQYIRAVRISNDTVLFTPVVATINSHIVTGVLSANSVYMLHVQACDEVSSRSAHWWLSSCISPARSAYNFWERWVLLLPFIGDTELMLVCVLDNCTVNEHTVRRTEMSSATYSRVSVAGNPIRQTFYDHSSQSRRSIVVDCFFREGSLPLPLSLESLPFLDFGGKLKTCRQLTKYFMTTNIEVSEVDFLLLHIMTCPWHIKFHFFPV